VALDFYTFFCQTGLTGLHGFFHSFLKEAEKVQQVAFDKEKRK